MTTAQHNYSGTGTEGTKYQATKELCTKEIAVLIRKELKSPVFAGLKFSVRSEYNHIRVEITDAPENFEVINPEFEAKFQAGENTYNTSRFNDNANALISMVEGIVSSYNYNDSNSQIDYFSVNFYSSVSFCYKIFNA